ncbi:MAG: TnsD family Tn7-like transposition protein [Bacillota bacterium]
MLAFFPQPYEDEDLRSIIYRYHKRSGNRQFAHTILELFNRKSHKNVHIPNNFSFLQERLPATLDLLKDHTLLNYVTPFLNTEQLKYNSIHGILRGKKILSEKIRYCPICLQNDYDSLGECFVHKTHQIEFLKVCHKHGTALISQCPECSIDLALLNKYSLLASPSCPNGHDLKETHSPLPSPLEKQLYHALEQFEHYAKELDRSEFLKRLNLWLGEKGYYSFSGGVLFRRKLSQDIVEKYDPYELKKLRLLPSYIMSGTTMHRMINSKEKGSINVIYYLLLIIFLAGSVKSFFENHPIFALPIPFGNGPWPCLNRICPFYKSNNIRYSTRSNDRGLRIICEFKCKHCGSFYKRTWYWPLREEKSGRYFVKKGEDFFDEIVTLYKQGESIKSIATRLKTHYATVKKYLAKNEGIKIIDNLEDKLSLAEIYNSYTQVSCSKEEGDKLLDYRQKLKDTLVDMIDPKRSKLRKKVPTVYDWLLKNDRKWMESVLPVSKQNIEKINWEQVDKEISLKIEECANRLYNSPPPYRITPSTVLQSLSVIHRNRIRREPNKLPESISKLKNYNEDTEKFQIRYLPIAVSRIKERGLTVNFRILKNRFPTIYKNVTENQRELISVLIHDNFML